MEVNNISFPARLLDILEDLSKCTFLAIDFEFSGIATRSPQRRGEQSLQERYRETKAAAERYQILQAGLTFAIYDEERSTLVLKPYNLNLSPLLDERLDVERVVSFQSSAVEFLLRHGFSMSEPFVSGVPYLSRDEARAAKEVAYKRLERKNIENIQLDESGVEALAFCEELRNEIDGWLARGGHELEIASRRALRQRANTPGKTTTDSETNNSRDQGLSRFEKRLVHQFVRSEYPSLVTVSRGGDSTIRIIHLDEEREKEVLRKRKGDVKERINRHVGFRWIVDALTNRTLHRINVRSFSADPRTGETRLINPAYVQSRFDQVQAKMKTKKVPLVGHNVFTDLVYLYSTFVGPLPDDVEDFRDALHDLFPMIVDTKYMATHNCGDISPVSSLQEIAELMQIEKEPLVETHEQHKKYAATAALHEAGYDSYLTALVATRLSTKLHHESKHIEELPQAEEAVKTQSSNPGILKKMAGGAAPLLPPSEPHVDSRVRKKEQAKRKGRSRPARFANHNIYEKLGLLELQPDGFGSDDERAGKPLEEESTELSDNDWNVQAQPPPTEVMGNSMPPFNADFWQVYGNKLRVFGTVEGLLDLVPGQISGEAA